MSTNSEHMHIAVTFQHARARRRCSASDCEADITPTLSSKPIEPIVCGKHKRRRKLLIPEGRIVKGKQERNHG